MVKANDRGRADSAGRAFTEEFIELRRSVNSILRGLRSGQLGNSALMGGLIEVYDPNGDLKGQIGVQPDGASGYQPLNGAPPGQPSTPICTPIAAGVNIAWDGNFVAATRPGDFFCIEIYRLSTPAGIAGPSNFLGAMYEAGDYPDVPLDYASTYYYVFIAVNTSDKTPGIGLRPTASIASNVGSAQPEMVVAQDLLDGIVTEVKIATDAVTAAKVAVGAIGTAEIAGQAVTLASLANGAVDASKLLDGSVGTNKIQTDAVIASKIAADAVATSELAANSVVAGKVAADSINSNHLVTGSVQTLEIAADAVNATHIAANAVTAEQISALAITADKVAANAINAGHITAGAVTAAKLSATIVLASQQIIAGNPTGARVVMHATAGLLGYNSAGQATFQLDASTGNLIAVGEWRTDFSGERAIIFTDGTIRVYPSSGTNYSVIENVGSGVRMRGPLSGSNSGYIYMYSSGVELRYGDTGSSYSFVNVVNTYVNLIAPVVGARIDRKRAPSDGTVNRWFFVTTNSGGSDQSASVVHYYPRNTSDYKPILVGSNDAGVLIGESGGMSGSCNGNGTDWRDWTARNLYGALQTGSSETTKEDIREIETPGGYTSWDIIEGAPSLNWKYTKEAHQTPRGDKPRDPDGNPFKLKDADGEDFEVDWTDPEREIRARDHRFPLAEDLEAIDPDLVDTSRGDDPSLKAVDIRDTVGLLWDAVDMLIKRLRLVEDVSGLQLPPRPQKGTLAEGIGSVVPGRTTRKIDPSTGQIVERNW